MPQNNLAQIAATRSGGRRPGAPVGPRPDQSVPPADHVKPVRAGRNQAVGASLMDHRDAMDTERRSRSGPECPQAPVGIRGVPRGQPAAAGAPRTQPRSGKNPRGARGFCSVVVQSGGAATGRVWSAIPALVVSTGQCVARPVPVPEGRRRRLAGGKSAPADAAPGNRAEWFRAPAGHRRNGPGRWPSDRPEATSGGGSAAGRATPKNSPMPRWGRPVRRGNRGPHPLARACPRLISCGVPPGRGARRRRPFSDGRMVAGATASLARRDAPANSSQPIPLP